MDKVLCEKCNEELNKFAVERLPMLNLNYYNCEGCKAFYLGSKPSLLTGDKNVVFKEILNEVAYEGLTKEYYDVYLRLCKLEEMDSYIEVDDYMFQYIVQPYEGYREDLTKGLTKVEEELANIKKKTNLSLVKNEMSLSRSLSDYLSKRWKQRRQ